jgi:hypothetical protein
MKLIQENNGKDSSFRVVMLGMMLFLAWTMALFTMGFMKEISTLPIDWLGLAGFFTACVVNGSLMLFLKVIHKKYEKS